jgi:hypothetical protein
MKLNVFAGESGYYEFEGKSGSSPDLTVEIGKTYTFDQSDASNWYHPIGFAYEPDGAHAATWGGDELPEVEGQDQQCCRSLPNYVLYPSPHGAPSVPPFCQSFP